MNAAPEGTGRNPLDRALALRAHVAAGIGFAALIVAVVGIGEVRNWSREPESYPPGSAPALPDVGFAIGVIALGTALAIGLPAVLRARVLRSARRGSTLGRRARARVALGATLLSTILFLGPQIHDQLSGECSRLDPFQALIAAWLPLAVVLVTTSRRATALDLGLSDRLRWGFRLVAIGLFLVLVTDDLRCPLRQFRGIWKMLPAAGSAVQP
jgi:hypothetical protein